MDQGASDPSVEFSIFFTGSLTTLTLPLAGGVYNSTGANEYWTRRLEGIFGDNFRGLAPLQDNINAQAAANRALIP